MTADGKVIHDTQSLGHRQHGAEAGSIKSTFTGCRGVDNEAAVSKLVSQPGHRH